MSHCRYSKSGDTAAGSRQSIPQRRIVAGIRPRSSPRLHPISKTADGFSFNAKGSTDAARRSKVTSRGGAAKIAAFSAWVVMGSIGVASAGCVGVRGGMPSLSLGACGTASEAGQRDTGTASTTPSAAPATRAPSSRGAGTPPTTCAGGRVESVPVMGVGDQATAGRAERADLLGETHPGSVEQRETAPIPGGGVGREASGAHQAPPKDIGRVGRLESVRETQQELPILQSDHLRVFVERPHRRPGRSAETRGRARE